MMQSKTIKRIVIYCIVSLAVVAVILLNLHNEKFSSYHTADDFKVSEAAIVLSDIEECMTDWTSNFSGAFASTEWFYMPNSGIYKLSISADTRSENNRVELYTSDGRSEELLATAPIHSGSGTSSLFFKAKSNIKFAQIRVVFGGEGYIKVYNAEVYSDIAFNDTYFIAVVVAAILLIFGLYIFVFKDRDKHFEQKREALVDYVILLITVLFVSQPTMLGYLLYSHDIPFHLCRIDAIKDALLSGQFPVRIYPSEASGFGFGAPLYYPDLFLYIPAVLRIFGVSQQQAYISYLFLLNISTAFFSYYSAKCLFRDRFTALMVALLYTTAQYRLTNIYTRGAVGELTAMAFLPLIVCGIYEVFFRDKRKWWILAVGVSGVIESHIISIFIVLIFLVIFGSIFILRLIKEYRWISLLKAIGAVAAANLWFFGPFMESYTGFSTMFESQRVTTYLMSTYLSQVFDVFINPYGESFGLGRAVNREMGFSIGLPVIFAAASFLVWLVLRKRGSRYDDSERISLYLLVFGTIAVWFTTYHFPLREIIESGELGKILNSIQFPWRLLSIASICFSFCGAVGLNKVGKYIGNRKIMALVLVAVIAIPGGYYMYSIQNEPSPEDLTGTPIFRYTPYIDTLVRYREYLPAGFEAMPDELKNANRIPVFQNPEAKLLQLSDSNREFSFSYEDGSGYAVIPFIYYPGYVARNEKGEMLEVSNTSDMFLQVALKDNKSSVTVKYEGFKHWKIYELVSLLFMLFTIVFAVLKRFYPAVLKARKNADV